jgi:hypothetical protein
MQRDKALQVFLAAQYDAVLTAWILVLLEHEVPVTVEVPPWDHWDSYQRLYLYGLVTADEFGAIDIGRVFFSGIRPSQTRIYAVMEKLSTPEVTATESSMGRAKPPTEAFSNTALTKPGGRELGESRPPAIGLSRSQPRELSAIQDQPQNQMPPERPRKAREFRAFTEPEALPCTEPEGTPKLDARMLSSNELDLTIIHCGHPMELIDDDGEVFDPEVQIDQDYPVFEYLFHCTCRYCGFHMTSSASMPASRDTYR